MASEKLLSFLKAPAGQWQMERSGLVTRCRLAAEALAEGRSSVLLARHRDELNAARALVSLFVPSLSVEDQPLARPLWENPCLALPGGISLRQGRDVWALRMAVFYGLRHSGAHCLVASAESLLLRYMPGDFFAGNSITLTRGSDLAPELVLDQAVEWGYQRVPLVTHPGDMARRGDILDIFPAGYSRPLRLEFFGDTIDEMRLFDAESQRSLQTLDECTLLPVLPYTCAPADMLRWHERLDGLFAGGQLSENAHYSLGKALDAGRSGIFPGVLHAQASCLEDWLPPDTLWLLPGQADSRDALCAAERQLRQALEGEDAELSQPASLCLRPDAGKEPWHDGCRGSIFRRRSGSGRGSAVRCCSAFPRPAAAASFSPWPGRTAFCRPCAMRRSSMVCLPWCPVSAAGRNWSGTTASSWARTFSTPVPSARRGRRPGPSRAWTALMISRPGICWCTGITA